MTKRLENLLRQQERIKLRVTKEKKKVTNLERKVDTRRKILIGAIVLTAMEKNMQLKSIIDKLLNSKLIRDNDRKLFNLPPLKK